MNKNLVSVIIPTHNREQTISRAIRSVLNQTYKFIEVVVVDDCSSDSTRDLILNEFGKNPKVVYHRLEKNQGACVARNKGVEISNGEFIAFLDSDDEFLPDKIYKQVDAIEKQNVQLCASDYTIINLDNTKGYIKTQSGTKEEVYSNLLFCNYITTGTLIGYRECFEKIPFDVSLPRYQDWDLVLRLCQKYKIAFIQESTLLQYTQPVSITKSTNHEKTLKALNTIYDKNTIGYKSSKTAYTQINWLIGLHSLFVKGQNPYKHLLIGATNNGLNFKRIGIMIASMFNKSIIDRNL